MTETTAHVHLWHHRHTPTTACTKPVHVCAPAEATAAVEQRLQASIGALRGLVEAVVAMKQAIPLQSLGVEWHEFLNKTGEVNLRLDLSEDLLVLLDTPPPASPRQGEPVGLDVERLRAQNHENAAMRDRENAALRSKVAKYERAMAEARERVKDWPADWTTHPNPGGWWRFTSENHRHEVAALIEAVRLSPHPAEPVAPDKETP